MFRNFIQNFCSKSLNSECKLRYFRLSLNLYIIILLGLQRINTYIFHIKFKWLCTLSYEQVHKEPESTYFTLSVNEYIFREISSEKRNRETHLTYFKLSLNNCILCEICYEQVHKESSLTHFGYPIFQIKFK